MDAIVLLQETVPLFAVWRLSLAALLGGIVGIEREFTGHPAGLRTNILIATSSCLFTLLSIHAFPLNGAAQDTARVAAQIVTGVGFLGAGAVIQTKRAVYGLTTAATIWMVAALGMAVATDYWAIAIIMTVLTSGMLLLLGPLSAWLAAKSEVRTVRREKHFRQMVEDGLRKEESRNQ
jgi:putative Mg2+ transporter-C (MgtC) family protein